MSCRNLKYLSKSVHMWRLLQKPYNVAISHRYLLSTTAMLKYSKPDKMTAMDISYEDTMKDDPEFARDFAPSTSSSTDVKTTEIHQDHRATNKVHDIEGIPLAPVDIDPWADDEEDELKQGTVDLPDSIEICTGDKGDEYPPIPEVRAGEYQFKGIKVKLPSSMLNRGTYRYRLDKEDEFLADDIRVCRYDK